MVFALFRFLKGLAPGHFRAWAFRGLATPPCEQNNRSASTAASINVWRTTSCLWALPISIPIISESLIFSHSSWLTRLASVALVAMRIARADFREGLRVMSRRLPGVEWNSEPLTPTQTAIGWCRSWDYDRSM